MAYQGPGCLVVHITLPYDIMNADTLRTIMFLIMQCGFEHRILVWFAFCCIGGSQLQPLNIARGSEATKILINNHQEQFMDHFSCTEPIAQAVRNLGGKVTFELPSTNCYWKGTLITNWIHKLCLQAFFNGCMYGLSAPYGPAAGQLMLKSWNFATDM